MALTAGDKLGPYEIVSIIGKGGMGEVYRAHDQRTGRDVAIKVSAERFNERFDREVRAVAALNHPNICTLYDVGPNYLVMELVEGESPEGPLPVELALNYARQIAAALEAAHEKGIVHRDLKPANIKVKADGTIKVLDFGLAKISGPPAPQSEDSPTISMAATQAGVILGTAAYMAPEQARGKPVDKRADIWAFGVVLYVMLTGKRPFKGEDLTETLASVVKEEPNWTPVPARALPLLRRCLEKDPKRRLRDIGDAMPLLEGGLQPVTDLKPGRSLPWIAVTAVLLVALIVVSWIAWQTTLTVDHPLVRLSVDLGPDAVSGSNMTAAISPDGTRLAFIVHGSDGKTQLATRLLDEPQATLLSGTEGATDPFFKPDGQWIGFFARGKLNKVSVRGSAVIPLCDAADGRGAAWGEDDNIIATLDANTGIGLSRVPAAGGMPQALTNPVEKGEATHRWPQILPGGESVLFTGNKTASNYDDSSIEVVSLKTGQVKVVQPGGYFARYLATSKGSGYLVYLHQRTLFGVPFDLGRLEIRGTPAPLLDDVAGDSQTAGGQFDFSRNGTFVYLSGTASTGTWTLMWLDSAGKTQPLLASPGIYYNPRLSADGKRLAFSTNSDIEVYDLERERRTQLTFTTQTTTNFYPLWTPDGKHIVFETQGNSNWSLQWIRADGAGEAQPLRESKNRLAPYSLSPDGRRVAFAEQNADKRYDLWTLPLDTRDPEHPKPGQPELFLRTPFDEREPAFSPDGRWVAYTSTESGPPEVYVRPFPSGSGKSTISTGGGQFPLWSRDGRELSYVGLDNRIMTAAWKGDSFTAEKARPWSSTQNLDIGFTNPDRAPDGKRFVVSVLPQSDSAGEQKHSVHVTFLLNFFDEVRRRIPAGK